MESVDQPVQEDQENSHYCKFCDKVFDSGRSLGGHMRGHLDLISLRKGLKESHGLRDNPKKSWKLSDGDGSSEEFSCKKCGKGIPSIRSLCGHMKHHSPKGNDDSEGSILCKICGRGFMTEKGMYGHMRWHSDKRKMAGESEDVEDGNSSEERLEIPVPFRKKRSQPRYIHTIITSPVTPKPSVGFGVRSFSSDGKEVEEVAWSLLMLSKGVRTLDDPSPCELFQGEEKDEMEVDEGEKDDFEAGDIGEKCLRNVDIEFDVEGCDVEMKGFELKKQEEMGIGNEIYVANNKAKSSGQDFCVKEKFHDLDQETADAFDMLEGFDFSKKAVQLAKNSSISDKKSKSNGKHARANGKYHDHDQGYVGPSETSDCFKASKQPVDFGKELEDFDSKKQITELGKALSIPNKKPKSHGQHFLLKKKGHDQVQGHAAASNSETFKDKERECSICFKVFRTGQALGGHKRAHYNPQADRCTETELMKNNFYDIDTTMGGTSLKLSWLGGNLLPDSSVFVN